MKIKTLILFLTIITGSLTCFGQHQKPPHPSEKKSPFAKPRPPKKPKMHPSPHFKYRHLPRRGDFVKHPGKNAYKTKYKGTVIYYNNGIFYRKKGRQFVVIPPPVGIYIKSLPEAHRFQLKNKWYFYYYGTFYVKNNSNSEYIVVKPPAGATADALPEGYETVKIKGKTYYELDGIYYYPYRKDNGEVIYRVVNITVTK